MGAQVFYLGERPYLALFTTSLFATVLRIAAALGSSLITGLFIIL
jgi:hypothetical protein